MAFTHAQILNIPQRKSAALSNGDSRGRVSTMKFDLSRRSLIVGMGSTAVVSAGLPALVKAQTGRTQESFSVGMPKEGPDTPKLAAPLDARSITDQSMRAVKQLG